MMRESRTLAPWFAAEFLISYASMLLITGCYDWAYTLGATPAQRLWISAAWGLAYIFIAYAGGRVSEKFGARAASITLSGLCVITCLLGLLALAVPRIWMIPLVMLPFNMTCTMFWPAIESGLTRSPGKMPLPKRISAYNLAWSSAGFLAMFTHGMLESVSYALIFIVPAGSAALAAVILGIWAPQLPHKPADVAEPLASDEPTRASAPLGSERPTGASAPRAALLLNMAWISNPLAYMAIYALIPIMTQLTGLKNEALAGIVGSIWLAVRFLGFALTGAWTGWHYKIRWQIGPLVALAASLAGMLLIPSLPVLILCQIVFGFSAAILYSASLYYSMHVSRGHGGHAAFHEAVLGMGTTTGPMIGALAATGAPAQAMPRIALGVSALLTAGLAVIVWMSLTQKTDNLSVAESRPR
jgi:MFS family permease